MSTDERVVLVTGAAGGIGSAIALAFADAGWRVYATDLEQPPESVRERCRYRELDVSDADRCRAVVDGVLAESGRLDCLVNNAGYAEAGPVADVPADERTYAALVDGWVLEGPLAVAPERVAAAVVRAAEAERPRARYLDSARESRR
ncbi:hypothetical protein BRC92_03225 [Halobacteriales archaeon QS_4_69_31]|nr:MAG: hypothetical protein BRC92_03225 [Halobacteriales archaeon QS_4_69_31]